MIKKAEFYYDLEDLEEFEPAEDWEAARVIAPEEILHWFKLCDAAWVHDGDPAKPHAELTSGLCSNGFFDCLRILSYPNLGQILAQQLVKRLDKELEEDNWPDWVVGSAYAAITFSYEVAKSLYYTRHGFVEKDPADPRGKRMLWQRMSIPSDSLVLQVEDQISTSGTFREVRRAVEEGNGAPVNFLPFVGAVVHRPPKLPADYGGIKVVSLVEQEVWAVEPKDCPLCKVSSPRFRPKTHWKELTGKK